MIAIHFFLLWIIFHDNVDICDIFEACSGDVMFVDEKHGVVAGNVSNAFCEATKFVCIAVDPYF